MKGLTGRIGLLLLIGAAIAAFFLFDLGRFLTLENIKEQQTALADLLAREPALVIGGFFLAYVAVTALSLPGAAIMTLAAGAIFDLWVGTLIVSFASAIGATLAFLSARYLLRDWVKGRFPKPVRAADRGVAKDGIFYLLTLRLIPAFPFFLVNLAMGLTGMRLLPYFFISQLGMLPGTFVYVNAGTQLGAIESTRDILSPTLIGSFVLLGLFPLIAKWAIAAWQRRKVYRGWQRPKRFDRNLIVIGAGAGGLVTSLIGATVRAKVTLIEQAKMGGDCLNTGCVPSKTLIRAARLAHEMRTAGRYGLTPADPPVPFAKIMARVREAIRVIEPADSVERYTELGVDVRRGHATIVDPWTVAIDGGDRLTARAIVIAAGGEPAVPGIPGLTDSGYLTSDTMWDALAAREAPPERLVVIGGGPIGCELSQAFARLGSSVVQVQGGARILPKEDAEVSALVAAAMRGEGVDLRLDHEALRVEGKVLFARHAGQEVRIAFDELIVAVGRKARLQGYG
ncbi:MAG: FAD-dependent oxidoreductase, partial [Sphingopyxis sp.]